LSVFANSCNVSGAGTSPVIRLTTCRSSPSMCRPEKDGSGRLRHRSSPLLRMTSEEVPAQLRNTSVLRISDRNFTCSLRVSNLGSLAPEARTLPLHHLGTPPILPNIGLYLSCNFPLWGPLVSLASDLPPSHLLA